MKLFSFYFVLLPFIFVEFVRLRKMFYLQDRRDKERKNGGKERQWREKEKVVEGRKGKERSRSDGTDSDIADSHGFEDIRRSGRDKDRKHRKRHTSSLDDTFVDENDRDRSRKSYKQSDGHQKKRVCIYFCIKSSSNFICFVSQLRLLRGKKMHYHGPETSKFGFCVIGRTAYKDF